LKHLSNQESHLHVKGATLESPLTPLEQHVIKMEEFNITKVP